MRLLALATLLALLIPSAACARETPLYADGKAHAIRSAQFTIYVMTEGTPHLSLDLEIVVDEHSGEDGALAPTCSVVPRRKLPALGRLAGYSVDERRGTWEAFYGNDAPALDDNVLRIVGFPRPDRVHLQWTARYGKERLRFDGVVPFEGIRMRVKKPADAERMLHAAWPALDVKSLRRTDGPWTDYGKDAPAERRRWLNVTFRLPPTLP